MIAKPSWIAVPATNHSCEFWPLLKSTIPSQGCLTTQLMCGGSQLRKRFHEQFSMHALHQHQSPLVNKDMFPILFENCTYIYIYNIVYSTIQKQCSPNRTGDVPSSKLTELWEIDGNCPFIHDFPMTKCQLSPRNPRKEYRKYEKYYVLSLGLDFSIFEFFWSNINNGGFFEPLLKTHHPSKASHRDALGEVQLIHRKGLLEGPMNASQVDHQLVVHEDPHILRLWDGKNEWKKYVDIIWI